jgi:hypothetical protein
MHSEALAGQLQNSFDQVAQGSGKNRVSITYPGSVHRNRITLVGDPSRAWVASLARSNQMVSFIPRST